MSFSLDPRTRLLLVVMYAALVAMSRRTEALLVELVAVILLIVLAGESREYLRWLRLVVVMVGAWFGIALLAFDRATAISAGLRLLALTSAFFLLFRTTVPEDLGNALVKIGVPYSFAFLLGTSLHFVPMISRKAQNVVDAQRSRGIPLEPGLSALRHYPALFAPLLIQAFQLADDLAEAMEARGFGRPGRSFAREYRLRAADWLALATGLVILGAAALARL